jgi:hypothetical protein
LGEGFDDGLPPVILQPGLDLLMEVFWWLLGLLCLAAVGYTLAFLK